ncbi:MAG: glycosyltransferase family 4 protein [Desulfobacter sp.]|nr:MAG: glycosyltransferase family 4 protein [Desulfobacter sp.]
MKISVIILYDVKGWAWWYRARNIQRFIHEDIRVDVAGYKDRVDYAPYDLIILFECSLIHFVPAPYRSKVVLGTSTTITEYLDELLVAVEAHGCLAGLVNNLTAFNKAKGKGRFYCCENGVDETFFYPGDKVEKSTTACWIGNACSVGNKGLDLIRAACIQAGVSLIFKNVDARDGDTSKIISHDLIRDRYYHRAGFYICASETEGTPNTALEALSCGLPVLTTRVGNMPEVISPGKNGYFIDRSITGIRDGIESILNADIKRLGANARKSIIDGWTWKAKVKNYEAMIFELMGTGSR